MPIPKEILSVKRPVNTIVIAYGKDKSRYAVRQRIGCRNVGGRHLPVNGPTIGHIVNGEYVPLSQGPSPVKAAPVDLRDWANVELCVRKSEDILGELGRVYSAADAARIFCIAILRVCYPGVSNSELKERYEDSFLCERFPGVSLSRNAVSEFLNDLGKACSRISQFMRHRAEAVGIDHHLLVDGTLKTDDSKVNSLSDFSRKAAKKGTKDISLLYAFDLEEMEPVCSQCFPGNMLDLTAYESFLSGNHITKGLVVADKGFPSDAAKGQFAARPDLHFLNPVKRNAKVIERHELRNMTDLLPRFEDVTFRKEKCSGKQKWLYAFRDAAKAAMEEQEWLRRAREKGNYTCETFLAKQRSFGTIVLECDLDLPPETVYRAYASRWEIEIVMRYYKNACQFDDTRVQDDYSLLGSEFCDFLATVVTFRIIKAFDAAKLLEKRNYSRIMAILRRAKKARMEGEGWQLIRMNPSHREILQELDLLPKPEEPPKRKRGRPRKNPL